MCRGSNSAAMLKHIRHFGRFCPGAWIKLPLGAGAERVLAMYTMNVTVPQNRKADLEKGDWGGCGWVGWCGAGVGVGTSRVSFFLYHCMCARNS